LAKELIVVIRGALLALSHLQAQDLLVDVNLEKQDKIGTGSVADPDPPDPALDPDPSVIKPI
jgi:hypothetical protein